MMDTTELTARDIMTAEVIAVQADDLISEAAQLLLDARITGAPVVDLRGDAVGVFTLAHAVDFGREATNGGDDESFYRLDLPTRWPTRLTIQEPLKDKRVADVMTPRVHSVPDTSSVHEVTSYLLDRAIHRVFVRDAQSKLIGIITSMDLLRVFDDLLTGVAEGRAEAAS